MIDRVRFCWITMVCVVASVLLMLTDGLKAQMNDVQDFGGSAVPFNYDWAVEPNPVANWSLVAGCSPGWLFKDGTRGDNGTNCLRSPLPVGVGTRMVRDLNPGAGSSTIGEMKHAGVDVIYRLLVSADDGLGVKGQELYWVMGSLYPVMTLKDDINPGAGASSPTDLYQQWPGGLNIILFSADDGSHGREPWVSEMSPLLVTSEAMVMDINPGPGGSDPGPFRAAAVPNIAMGVFAANDGVNGREIWQTHIETPTEGDPYRVTALVKDINTTSAGASSDPQSLTTLILNSSKATYDVRAFFTADDGVNGRELWRTDGTLAGTGIVKEFGTGAAGAVVTNLTVASPLFAGVVTPKMFFTVDSDGANGMELWMTSGALGGADTVQVKDTGASPSALTASGALIYFVSGNDLWKSDGTTGGTVLVKTFASPPANLVSIGSGTTATVYFAADDGTGSGVELWKATSTGGASLVKDIQVGPGSSSPANLTVGTFVAFTADDGVNGRELWRTDTAAGAVLVKDIYPGATGSNPAGLFMYDYDSSMVFFSADDGSHGRELWQSDGFADPPRTGPNYKWDLAPVIQAKGDPAKVAVIGTNANPLTYFGYYDFPTMGGTTAVEVPHQMNIYMELTDGTDRVPLVLTNVDCGDGNYPRPRAALTDGTLHKAIAFGMVAVLDQDPCDTDPRGPGSPGVPFAYVPAVFDGLNWIPMDRAHITPGVPSSPPTGASLAQGPWAHLSRNSTLPSGLVAATSDPSSQKRFTQVQMVILDDYVHVVWAGKNTGNVYVATVLRQYKGGFKAAYFGTAGCVQSAYPYYFDTLYLNGGLLTTSPEPHGACCSTSTMTCSDVGTAAECVGGRFKPWKSCSETKVCCPTPFADADFDGDVDQDDFGSVQACYNGTGAAPASCICLNRDSDTDVDTTDVTAFMNCFTGPNVPWVAGLTPSCVP